MLNDIKIEELLAVVSQLGVWAIFLYLYINERKQRDKDREASEARESKASDKLVEIVQNNTAALEGNKNSIDNNTKVIDRLASQFDDILRRK